MKIILRLGTLLCLIIGFLSYSTLTFSSSSLEKLNHSIVIMQNVEHPALNATREGILDELKHLQNLNIEVESAQGNPSLAVQIAQKFVSQKPLVMVGIGTISAQALLAANKQKSIPLVFSSVTDPVQAKLIKDPKKSYNKVTGVSNFIDPSLQFELFKKIIPTLTKIGIIYNTGEPNSIALNEYMQKIAPSQKLELVFSTANTTADVPLSAQALVRKVDAIFINNDNTALSAFDAVVKIATQNNIPVFCSDTDTVKQGALAAIGPNQYDIGRQTGKIILRIIKGEPINEISVEYPEKKELFLNLKQAKKLNIVIPESLQKEAAQLVID